jgi:putative ABC transport system permease protein
VLLGATTVVFAAGLATSLNRVAAGVTRTAEVPVEVHLFGHGQRKGGPPTTTTQDPATVATAIQAQPGTAHAVAVTDVDVALVGYTRAVTVQAYHGDATWVGYPLVSGHWYAGPDEVVAASTLLRAAGRHVGDEVTVAGDKGQRRVRIVGEVFDVDRDGLTLLLSTVAALGVLNTVVLNTRERVHEIGVLKTLGMTPRQVRAMVVASMVGIGVLAAPLGYALHHRIVPVMADAAAGTGIPASFLDVYRPVQLAGLAGAAVVLAVLGALIPAGWAAGTRIATALRAE